MARIWAVDTGKLAVPPLRHAGKRGPLRSVPTALESSQGVQTTPPGFGTRRPASGLTADRTSKLGRAGGFQPKWPPDRDRRTRPYGSGLERRDRSSRRSSAAASERASAGIVHARWPPALDRHCRRELNSGTLKPANCYPCRCGSRGPVVRLSAPRGACTSTSLDRVKPRASKMSPRVVQTC